MGLLRVAHLTSSKFSFRVSSFSIRLLLLSLSYAHKTFQTKVDAPPCIGPEYNFLSAIFG
jgi:hypothetical protein